LAKIKLERDELTTIYFDKLEVIQDDVFIGDGERELSMWIGRKPEDSRTLREAKRRRK
jgi:hypothetical protein